MSCDNQRGERKFTFDDASRSLDDIKTKLSTLAWDKAEANLFADPPVTGVKKARI